DELGVVISDEIHYINDPERGTVWEETLMHLPQAVQPEAFVDWIKSTRNRDGVLIR
ncbi:hypothetical protein T492DRAFT_871231, partial [Pavlovales sp. CCMP2436]